MENLGDYIYLIVLVIAAISAIAKKKKRAEQEEFELPDLPELDELIPEYTEVKPRSEVIYQPVRKVAVDSEVDKRAKTPNNAKPQKTTVVKQLVEVEDTEDEVRLDTVEDARRAFISAEIFNRKY